MSVSNIVPSFSPTAFFKVGGEMLQHFNRPSIVLIAGSGIGETLCLIQDIRRISNDSLNQGLKKKIEERITMAHNTWLAAGLFACIGLAWPHRSFVILTAASSILSFIFLRNIKSLVQETATREKLEGAVNRAWLTLVPTAAVLTCMLLSALPRALAQKV